MQYVVSFTVYCGCLNMAFLLFGRKAVRDRTSHLADLNFVRGDVSTMLIALIRKVDGAVFDTCLEST